MTDKQEQRWTIGKWGRYSVVRGPDTGPAESSKEVVEVIPASELTHLRQLADEWQRRADEGGLAIGLREAAHTLRVALSAEEGQ